MTTTERLLTPSERHSQARRGQATLRLVVFLVFLVGLGPFTALLGLILYGLIRKQQRRAQIAAVGLLAGGAILWFGGWHAIVVSYGNVRLLTQTTASFVQAWRTARTEQYWQAILSSLWAIAPYLLHIWLIGLVLAPALALFLVATRTRTIEEQRAEKAQQERNALAERRRAAERRVAQAPDAVTPKGGDAKGVVGVTLGGDLGWTQKAWVTYTREMLNLHGVVVGGSGMGKTEFIMRMAYLARKVYGWKVFYVDAKGDPKAAQRFRAVMRQAGVARVAMFPDDAYNGWVGDATAILNRMLSIQEYSEPYYKEVARTVLSLALKAEAGVPRSSEAFINRLALPALDDLYVGQTNLRTKALQSLKRDDVDGVMRRHFGFFDALDGKLDGQWSFDSVDAGYFLIKGLALREEARNVGRFLLEDFAHYASERKPASQGVLLIVDDFSAISENGGDAANLFERLRSFNAAVLVTAQSKESLGEDVEKLIGAAAVTVAFQCADPHPLVRRAGTVREVQSAVAAEYATVAGVNAFTTKREHIVGTSIQREQEVPKLHPDTILRLNIGECCIIANGAYQMVRVAQIPEVPQPQASPVRPMAAERTPVAARGVLPAAAVQPKLTEQAVISQEAAVVTQVDSSTLQVRTNEPDIMSLEAAQDIKENAAVTTQSGDHAPAGSAAPREEREELDL